MQLLARSLVASLSTIVCLWPAAAGAHMQDTPSSAPLFTVDQTRSAFSSAGYSVDQAYVWKWTVPPVASFQVRDPANDRVVMVLVYPNVDGAQLARDRAESSDGRLVTGFGASTWRGNVALVQTTESQLQAEFQAQSDRDHGIYVDRGVEQDPSVPTAAVDADFLEALSNGAANL